MTGAGDTTDNMQKMGDAILGISTDTGIMTSQLLPAMYQIISAGQRGTEAQDTLSAAAKGAVIEQANVVDVTNALVTAMTDYGTKQYNATQYMNGYIQAVKSGRITLEELSTSMGPLLPIAHILGIHFADVAAAMSTMTNAGLPAARAATSLRFLFQSLENPTAKAEKAMKAYGLSSIAVGNELKVSLPGALQMVYDAAKKAGPEGSVPFNRAVSDMIGGQRSLQAFLSLTGGHMSTFASLTKSVTAAMNGSKTSVQGWDIAQSNFNVQANRGKAALNALAITVGTALLPVLTQIFVALTPLIIAFTSWIASIMQNKTAMAIFVGVLVGLATIILVIVVPAFVAWAIATIAATWPILLIGAIVAAVVAAVIIAIQHWGAIVAWLKGIWSAIAGFFSGIWNTIKSIFTGAINAIALFFIGIWTSISGFFTTLWKGIVGFLSAIWNVILAIAMVIFKIIVAIIILPFIPLILFFKAHWTQIHAFLVAAWNAIKSVATVVWNAISSVITTVTTTISRVVTTVWNTIKGILLSVWNVIKGAAISIWNTISGFLIGNATALWGKLTGIWNAIKSAFASAMNALGGIAHAAWNVVVGVIKGAINAVISVINGFIGGINAITHIVGIAPIGRIPYLASGIENFGGGLAYVHAGEVLTYLPKGASVIPANRVTLVQAPQTAGPNAGTGGNTIHMGPINIYAQHLDPAEVNNIARQLGDKLRAQMGTV